MVGHGTDLLAGSDRIVCQIAVWDIRLKRLSADPVDSLIEQAALPRIIG